MIDRLAALEERYEELGSLLSQPEVVADLALLQKYAREHSELSGLVDAYRELKVTETGIADARSWMDDGADDELRELARETLEELQVKRSHQLAELKRELIP